MFKRNDQPPWFSWRPTDNYMFDRGYRRVLLTADTAGGVWTFALELAEGLIRRGIEVSLATFGPAAKESQRRSAAAVARLHWHHCVSKLEWMEDPWSEIEGAGDWLSEIVRQYRPDVIHLNTLCHGDLPWDVPVVMTVHSCVASWWAAVKDSPLPPNWGGYQRKVESSLKCATLVTAPTHALLSAVGKYYDVDMTDAVAIHNGRKARLFQRREKEPFILSAGRLWDEAKNIGMLAGIAARLPWPVYVAGDSRHPDGAQTTLSSCRSLGELSTPELADWYARAAIYASPAQYEPFGLSNLEAALSGCALALSDIASLREIWRDAAVFVNPNDPRALETALQQLIQRPVYREQMAQRAFRRATAFTQSRMTDGYLAAYRAAGVKHNRAGRHACAL